MEEQNIKEEVYKCSKCGLCQSVCPIFLAVKNEMYLPRGRYNVLNNFFNNKKSLSKKFIKELDICLNCNACKNFCPSSIDSAEIFTLLKSKYRKFDLSFNFKYKLILLFHSIRRYFVKSDLYKITTKRFYKGASLTKTDVVYFEGCFNRYINPSDKNASINLIEKNGYRVNKVLHGCCGLSFLSDGNLKAFEKNKNKIIKSIPHNIKDVVVSCDSCYKTLLKVFEGQNIKVKRFEELLIDEKDVENALYHKPFSRENYNGKLPLINKKGSCSLMENYFMLKHPDFAKKLLNTVFYNKEDVLNKSIVTSCNLDRWGLIENFRRKGIKTKVYSLAEYTYETGKNIV